MRFKQWIENQEGQEIKGEYWIQNGNVDSADGIGDKNHESIASEYIFNKYSDEIISLAEKLNINIEEIKHFLRYEVDVSGLTDLVEKIIESLENQKRNQKRYDVDSYLINTLKCNKDALDILKGGGNSPLYVMKYERWIAVRNNNIELYDYNINKRKELLNGLKDILYEEGHEEPNPDMEFSFYDHKNNKHSNYTLAQLESSSMRPKQLASTKAKMILPITKDSGENQYSNPVKSKPKIWQQGQFWTSESVEVNMSKDKSNKALNEFLSDKTTNPFNNREIVVGDKGAIEVYVWDGNIHVSSIRSFISKQGFGTEIMRELINCADKYGATITLNAVPIGNKGPNQKKLISWYKTLGFKPEYRGGDYLIRKPTG